MQWQSLQQYQLQSRWLLSYRQSSADKWQDGIIIVDLVIMAIGKMALLLLLSNFTLVTNITNTDVSFNKNINIMMYKELKNEWAKCRKEFLQLQQHEISN